MMRRLHVRFALSLAVLMTAVGAIFFMIESKGSELYHQELTQRLNAPIAMYVAGAAPLVRNGVVNEAALATLAERAMIINPAAEIYLLDTAGVVIGAALDAPGRVGQQIDLASVRAVLSGSGRLPVLGDDPASNQDQKVFSVSEVRDGDSLAGYVYVILGGARYAETKSTVEAGYRQRMVVAAIALISVTALLIGWGLFAFFTRRLKRLTREVCAFSVDDSPAITIPPGGASDELDVLETAFEQMSARIASQVERLRENNRLRRELISNVSHDLRTPLSAMQGYLDTLLIKQADLSNEERMAMLEIARRHAGRLGNLVRDLFELTRLDTGNIQPAFEAFSLAELVSDVAQSLTFKASQKNIKLMVAPPVGDTTVIADIALIQRVLENLIDNAIKYTADGGEVSVSLRSRGENCGIDVADTGAGIDQAHLPHIFERHYAVAGESVPAGESTGLGLAIVKKILDLHDAQIKVDSVPSEGTRFHFELPAADKAA
ncbi:MAG: ATP-binding protein [Pseudomonadota bacterium]